MKSLQESVVTAMDGSDVELYSFLPYILQDSWEIGTAPEVIIGLVRKHGWDYSYLRVLDLGCGKGAVAIRLAKEFACRCLGIDALREFITVAGKKAGEFGVAHLCLFETGDIRERLKTLPRFDLIILGSIGPVLGDYYSTLTALSGHLYESGLILIADGYIENDSPYSHPLILKRGVMLRQIEASGMAIIDEVISKGDEIKEADARIFSDLDKRCRELIVKYPDKRRLFEAYIRKQEEENDVLETKIVCTTMVLKK